LFGARRITDIAMLGVFIASMADPRRSNFRVERKGVVARHDDKSRVVRISETSK
jgi:hypothetical protein